MKVKEILIYGCIILVAMLVLVAGWMYRSHTNLNPNVILTHDDLGKDVGYQLCTASVNTVDIYCKSQNVIIPTYNRTQDEIIKALDDCPDWEMMKGTHCIGEYVEVRGK